MHTLAVQTTTSRVPIWLAAGAGLGILWNLFGIYRFVGTFTPSGRAAMTAGMTADQAALYLALPVWVSAVFAIGVFGGLIGSIMLALRQHAAPRVFAASFVGYGLLFAGDVYYGVFAAIPSQLIVLGVVLLIAATLWWTSRRAGRLGLLR